MMQINNMYGTRTKQYEKRMKEVSVRSFVLGRT